MPMDISELAGANFLPHGHCYFWDPVVMWLNVLSDGLIAFSYYSIPVAILYFVRKRSDLIFHWMFFLFAVFIFACGTTHVMEIINVWNGKYLLTGFIKFVTAVVSTAAAILLWPLIPKALALRSPKELAAANEELQREIGERRAAEQRLNVLNQELEERVQEATKHLQEALDKSQRTAAKLKRLDKEREALLEGERRARSEAEKANRMKDEFLAILSHELRTPLNAILGWSQLLKRGSLDKSRMSEGLETIERNVRAQTRIVDDLLDMSRIVSGKVQLDVIRCDLRPIVESAMESLRPAAEAKGIDYKKSFPPMRVIISGDPNRIQQVIYNLISNAIKFTESGGAVEVAIKRVASHVELSVIDTGKGISEEFLPFVFDRFRQADSSTTRKFGGLGLGLSIVKHIVEMHGGTVRVESKEGAGSTFTVMLPLVAVYNHTDIASGGSDEILQEERAPLLKDLRVLVVDDEADARTLVRFVLEEQGAKVLVAGSASEALELYGLEDPELLVSDIGMPGNSGHDLIKWIRATEKNGGRHIPAIALTAFARSEEKRAALLAGFDRHLAKPVEPSSLISMIESVLEEFREGKGELSE